MRPYVSVILLTLLASACAAQPRLAATRPGFWGFAAPWDTSSDATIRAHGHHLAVAVTGWIGLDSATGRPLLPSPFVDTVRPHMGTPDATATMAIVTSWHGERFHRESIRRLARDAGARARTAGAIARHAGERRYAGLVIDFETLERADLAAQLSVIGAIADSARAHGARIIAVAVPATDTAAYPARELLRHADAIIPMLYDEHWSGSPPGPVASPRWARGALALRVREAGADRVIAGFPTYGYRWIAGRPTEALGYAEARALASRTGVALRRDPATQSLSARGPGWEIWMADAETLQALVRSARELGVARFALWRLGREDSRIWGDVVR